MSSYVYTAALIVAAGLAGSGVAVGHGLVDARRADRFVTVKGVSEREVEADLAFWSITLSAPAAELQAGQAELERSVATVVSYLGEFGLEPSTVSLEGAGATDHATQVRSSSEEALRFVVSQTVLVRSTDVDAVHAASQEVGRLLAAGVPMTSGSGWGYSRPTYSFTRLNDVKPQMIAEATASAREAAQQFANDSGGTLGGIRRANQGVFVILARDQAPGVDEAVQRLKTVRVVTTVEYYLQD